MPNFIFSPKREKEIEDLRDILIGSNAICCEAVAPEVVFSGVHSYLIHGYDHQVIIDFNKMAKALYDSGYRKGERLKHCNLSTVPKKDAQSQAP